jgi:hypothetical protein
MPLLDTPTKRATLKADILAHSDTFMLYDPTLSTGGNLDGLAALLNATAVPDYWVWRTEVTLNEVGRTFNPADLAGLTSLNTARLQNLAAWLQTGVNPSVAEVRQFFDDIFSGAGGAATRAALLILWRRKATRLEKIFASGAGTTVAPSLLVVEGTLPYTELGGL